MASRFSSFIKKKLLGSNRNLISIEEPYEVMRRLLKGRQVTGIIDAGASNGRISKRLLRKFPAAQVYAFEPNPYYAQTLQRYASEDSRFHPYFLALSDYEGSDVLHVTRSAGITSLFTPTKRLKAIEPQGSLCEKTEEIQIATIDQWAKRNGSPAIQLLKMDIQGSELKALRGSLQLLKQSILLIYTEICFNCLYEGTALYSEIDLFLREQGFLLYDIFKPRYDTSGHIAWGNAIFLNNQRLGL